MPDALLHYTFVQRTYIDVRTMQECIQDLFFYLQFKYLCILAKFLNLNA